MVLPQICRTNAVSRANRFFVPAVDADGIIRSVPLLQEFENQLFPSLALATGLAYFMVDDVALNVARLNKEVDVIQGISLVDNYIPTGAIGDVLVPYAGGKKTYPYVSATDVLEGEPIIRC